uniref:MARVEL domain-containing protein n=1 Tax=Caenorhabditis tropicalis TaxID=1561998 RepID=A0A1I7V188_9PELO
MSVVSDGDVISDGMETSTVLSTILTTVVSTWASTTDYGHSTKYPPPRNWTPPNTTVKPIRMGNSASAKQAADQVAYGVIACVTVGVLLVMLYMCIFGQRLRATAVRWHVLNCSLWGILHLISYCSFADKAPWPNYITNQNWRDTAKQVECFTRSVFPAGMVFVYLESIILTIAPKLANSWIFNGIFFFLLIPFLNGLMIYLYCAHFMDVVWWYEPIDLFNLATYLLFVFFTFIYFIFCLFGTCLCCATLASKKTSSVGIDFYSLFSGYRIF